MNYIFVSIHDELIKNIFKKCVNDGTVINMEEVSRLFYRYTTEEKFEPGQTILQK